jgi:autotransporter-associated beta strand protein
MGSAGSPAVLQLGAIQFGNNSNDLLIGTSSTSTSGTLQLNGATFFIGGTQTDNVVIFNGSSTQALTIQNTVVSGGQSIGVSLGVANAIIHANVGSTISISAAISETGGSNGITFAGQGTTILSGTANSYSGGTTVSAGTLRVTNSSGSATGNGPVMVTPGATLSGTGNIIPNTGTPANDTVTVNGTVKPGTDSATGYFTVGDVSAAATVSVNGSYRWSLSSAGTSSTSPGGSDTNDPNNQSRLVVKGSLIFAPTTIDVVGLSGLSFDNTRAYSWRVATATGTVTVGAQPTFNTTGLDTDGGSFTLSSGLGAVFVGFSPAPEPCGLLLVCAGVTGVAWTWKRRSQPRQVVSVAHGRRTE